MMQKDVFVRAVRGACGSKTIWFQRMHYVLGALIFFLNRPSLFAQHSYPMSKFYAGLFRPAVGEGLSALKPGDWGVSKTLFPGRQKKRHLPELQLVLKGLPFQ